MSKMGEFKPARFWHPDFDVYIEHDKTATLIGHVKEDGNIVWNDTGLKLLDVGSDADAQRGFSTFRRS